MITKSELTYVNYKPYNTPYPGEEYSIQTLEKLKKCFESYNKNYLNKKYSILFSNNEEIDFEIAKKNLAHILGIEYKILMEDYKIGYRGDVLGLDPSSKVGSYNLLESIIENSDEVARRDKIEGKCLGINYFRVNVKCDIFSKLSDLSKFNYGCINFDKNIFNRENPNDKFGPSSTKLLYAESDEATSPFFMMGIKIDELPVKQYAYYDVPQEKTSEIYIAETLMTVDNPRRMFVGQEVVIPTQILTNDNGILRKNIATTSEKLKLLKEYKNVVETCNIPNKVNIYGDYYSMLVSDSKKLVL